MPPILDVLDVRMRFGGVSALDGLSFAVEPGDLVCIIGPNGCGKTTLFNVVSGALKPTAGRVFFREEDVTGLPAHRIAQRGLARKFQVPGVYSSLLVAENLEIALGGSRRVEGGIASLLRPAADRERLVDLLRLAQLEHKAAVTVTELSHGERQWLEIAMLLGQDPDLLLLDEPTAGMTIIETERTCDLVRRICHEFGKTVVVIEHDMHFVRRLASKVVVMMNGRVFREGDYETVQADPDIRRAYLGELEEC